MDRQAEKWKPNRCLEGNDDASKKILQMTWWAVADDKQQKKEARTIDNYEDDHNEDENGDGKDFWVLEASVPQLMTGSLFPPSSDLLDSFNVLSYTSLHSSHPTFIFFNAPFFVGKVWQVLVSPFSVSQVI